MNIPTVQEMRLKTRADLINWKQNCQRKVQEYLGKEPQTEFWVGLIECMEAKVDAITDFLEKNPNHLLNGPSFFSQTRERNPFRPTHQECQSGQTTPTYHRVTERVPPPGYTQKWEMATKMTPEENRKRKLQETENDMAQLKREAEELKEKFRAMKRMKCLLEAEEPSPPQEESAPPTPQTETFVLNEEGV